MNYRIAVAHPHQGALVRRMPLRPRFDWIQERIVNERLYHRTRKGYANNMALSDRLTSTSSQIVQPHSQIGVKSLKWCESDS